MITINAVLNEEADPAAELTGIQTKWIRKLIRNVVKDCRLQLDEEKARRVEIDFSSLAGIRSDALQTMEKLMTEAEMEDEFLPIIEEKTKKETTADPATHAYENTEIESRIQEAIGLSPEEQKVLRCLLENRTITSEILGGSILSVLVDSINEKLFDEIGDVVVEDGNPPTLIEDYREELMGLLGA